MADIEKKLVALAQKRQAALRLPAKEALSYILNSPDAPAIVHSLADQDFYFLINDIGPDDSLELLALASAKQWEYILDVAGWEKDRLDLSALTNWLELMMSADLDRLVNWLSQEKSDFLELFFYYQLELGLRQHDQEASEIGSDFFTFDDVYYLRLTPRPNAPADAAEAGEEYRQHSLYRFLKRLAELDYEKFRSFLFFTANVLPAEAEEEAYRLRNLRLAEKGLLPFEEAVGIYQPLSKVSALGRKTPARPLFDLKAPVPLMPFGLLAAATPFSQALAGIESAAHLRELQAELAALCNQLLVADQAGQKDRNELTQAVSKACGYIQIGLSKIAGSPEALDPARSAALLTTYPLADIFRLGYGEVMAVKQEATKWYHQSWFYRQQLPLHFWDRHLQGVLGGLLVKRPLFYDPHCPPPGFREFSRPEEVRQARTALYRMQVLDDWLDRADYNPALVAPAVLTFANLLLTAWARSWQNLPDIIDFIPLSDFRPFFEGLWASPESRAPGQEKGRVVSDEMKQSFLVWLAGRTGLSAVEISEKAGLWLQELFLQVESEYGRVAPDDLDPKYIDLFLVC